MKWISRCCVGAMLSLLLLAPDAAMTQTKRGVTSNKSKTRKPDEPKVKEDEAPKEKPVPAKPADEPASTKPEAKPKADSEIKPPAKSEPKPATPSAPLTKVEPKAKPAPVESKTVRGPILKSDLGEIEIFPADNPWNQEISKLPVHPKSSTWIESVGADRPLFPCFGADYLGAPNGIPYVVVSDKQVKKYIKFEYPDESDDGPYPIPNDPPIEGGPNAPEDSDRHVIMIDAHNKKLYELFHVLPAGKGNWKAGSGAIFDLTSNKLRPWGWTSADAAGLPIFPGLVRYDETMELGEIKHALRFTVRKTQRAYIAPATHFASKSNDSNLPPMGLRVRLRADYDISNFPKPAKVILTCLKRYGMFLADNGSDWFITGSPDNRWNDDDLHTLKRVKGRDLECVVTGELRHE